MRISTWACAKDAINVRVLRKKTMARMARMGCPSRWRRPPAQPRNNPARSPAFETFLSFLLLSPIKPEHDMKSQAHCCVRCRMPDAATTLAMGALAQHWPWAAYKCGGIDKSRRTIRPCAGAVPHTWKRTTFASRAAREIAAQPVARIARSLPFAASAVRSPARASAQALAIRSSRHQPSAFSTRRREC